MKGEERYLVNMLSFDETTFGIQDFKVDLRELFPLIGDRRDFYTRFEDFLESDR